MLQEKVMDVAMFQCCKDLLEFQKKTGPRVRSTLFCWWKFLGMNEKLTQNQ